MLRLAIVGRPNVGKSTLYNRFVGRKEAIVFDTPGVTRDRRYGKGFLGPMALEIIDTPGLEMAPEGSLARRMTAQAEAALSEAEVVLLVIDALAGITADDETFAQIVRRSGKPVVLVANKSESSRASMGITDAWRLGFGEPVAISAEHGEGLADLYEALAAHAPDDDETGSAASDDETVKLTVIGRPNAGKSTLINRLLGESRLLVGPEAGMTRDAVTIPFVWRGQKLELVDTAGLRKKGKVEGVLEMMSIGNTTYALRYTHVAILVVDATIPLEKQDNAIAGLIGREGRACVLALNKWDLVEDKAKLLKEVEARLLDTAPQMKGLAVVPVSAEKGQGLDALMKAALKAYERWNVRVATGELNRWLDEALQRHTPPLVSGRRFKIRFITQTKSRPPRFVVFANREDDIPDAYERYLINSLREQFDLPGVPIRFNWRAGKNPYAKD